MDGLLGDEKRHTTFRLFLQCSLEDQSIDKLVRMGRSDEKDRALAGDLP